MRGPTWPLLWFAVLFAWGIRVGWAEPGRAPTMVGGGDGPRAGAEIPSTLGVMHGPTRPGTAVYPPQTIPLRFDHGRHLALGLPCQACHTGIDGSRRAADSNFPRGRTCDPCHGPQHPLPEGVEPRCGLCHTAVDGERRVTAGLRAPAPLLVFNHALHAQVGSRCEDCHGDMSRVRLATALQLPREATCLACHDGLGATDRCGACHPTGRDGRLQTRAVDDRAMPALVPRGTSAWGVAHDLAFVEDHAGIAKANARLCEACHDESFCADCHAGVVRPLRIHPGDYINAHAVDARARAQDCQACHRTQTFCLSCHSRLGFDERSNAAFGVGGPLRFHPPGWSGPPGSAQDHAHAASRNMVACASCHTEDSCLACHATTAAATPGLGVNPHGPQFRGSVRCEALVARNRRVCLKCHAPGTPALDCR